MAEIEEMHHDFNPQRLVQAAIFSASMKFALLSDAIFDCENVFKSNAGSTVMSSREGPTGCQRKG